MQNMTSTCSSPSSTFHTPNLKGFTLIEAIITIVVVGIISSIAALIILEGMKASSKEQNLSSAHYQARIAMERMAREIRTINSQGNVGTVAIGTITGNPTNSLIFTDLTGMNITYSLSGQTLNRTVGGVPSTLATGVTTLEFRHYDIASALTASALAMWTIDISMTDTQGADSLPMRTRVHPMNF
jgi:prepilin-type N-terminal cleavage/methylation domain-containing protein